MAELYSLRVLLLRANHSYQAMERCVCFFLFFFSSSFFLFKQGMQAYKNGLKMVASEWCDVETIAISYPHTFRIVFCYNVRFNPFFLFLFSCFLLL